MAATFLFDMILTLIIIITHQQHRFQTMVTPKTAPSPRQPPAMPDGRPRVPLSTLLGSGTELVIEHQGQEYLLRLTSNGKLLLTK